MHVPIQHVIGTVALIALVITATLSFSIVSSDIEADVQEQQLRQISEKIASNIVELINIAKFSIFNYEPLMRTMDLPTDVGGATYTVQLVDGTGEGKGYYVKANLVTNQHIAAESSIPLNYTGTTQITLQNQPATEQIPIGLHQTPINSNNIIYGKPGSVVWAQANWDSPNNATITSIKVGLGWV